MPLDPRWLQLALEPPRAHGAPLGTGRLRVCAEDFLVEEELGFTATGTGAHRLLKVRKRNANTQWVARELARAAGCGPGEVGFAGMKDRRAIAVQWFTVPERAGAPNWEGLAGEGFEVLESRPHTRKLPRGALTGNRFVIRVREFVAGEESVRMRLAAIARRGVPNYFGPQRFGRDASNLEAAAHAERLPGPRDPRRGIALSAARSLLFNAVLAERVSAGSWDCLQPGDLANLDGRGSIFSVGELDESLRERSARLAIHPTGPLWGRGALATKGVVQALESRVASEYAAVCLLLERAGMAQERRALRLSIPALDYRLQDDTLVLSFRLARGGFATAVLREILSAGPQELADSST